MARGIALRWAPDEMLLGRRSLRSRLLLTASLVLLMFLGLMGVVLDHAFQRSAEQSVSERLLLHVYGLLTASDEINGRLVLPELLQEPDFNRMGSGLYAIVMNKDGKELWRSASAVDLSLAVGAKRRLDSGLLPGNPVFGRVKSDRGTPLFYLSYRVLWQGANASSTPYTFTVLQTFDTYTSEIHGFRNNLWGWLSGVVVVLIAVQALVMNWGLSPLKKLARDLKEIEDGHKDTLQGEYPAEIDGVTRNLNLLLASERQQREKYRTTLADLAHSLKTPLAILKGAASSLDYSRDAGAVDRARETIDEQVERMDEIMAYQLERAVSKSSSLISRPIAVKPVVDRLIETMRKVYADKAVRVTLNVKECSFFGDERDLMELLGNLVDNACKYCESAVLVDVRGTMGTRALMIVVEDDGAGIPQENRQEVLSRGARLDSQVAGQGIGLAVVVEIVNRYSGHIAIGDSAMGGARVSVTLRA